MSVMRFSRVDTSLVMRDMISPVRRLAKKLRDRVCRCSNIFLRKSVIMRFSVRSNK